MKLTDYKNEDALDLLADILEPLSKILIDKEVQKLASDSATDKMQAAKVLLKSHPKEIIQIMARIDGVPVEEYELGILTLPTRLIELFNDEALLSFFRSQGQIMVGTTFGSVTENTEETEKI